MADCHRIKSVCLSILNFQRIVQFNHCKCLSFENYLTKPTLVSIQINCIMANLLNLQKAVEFGKMKRVEIARRSHVFYQWVCVIIYSAILSSQHPAIRSWMVRNWQLHCRDFENLHFAKYLLDSSVPLGDFKNLDDSKYLNCVKQFFIKIQTFCKPIG